MEAYIETQMWDTLELPCKWCAGTGWERVAPDRVQACRMLCQLTLVIPDWYMIKLCKDCDEPCTWYPQLQLWACTYCTRFTYPEGTKFTQDLLGIRCKRCEQERFHQHLDAYVCIACGHAHGRKILKSPFPPKVLPAAVDPNLPRYYLVMVSDRTFPVSSGDEIRLEIDSPCPVSSGDEIRLEIDSPCPALNAKAPDCTSDSTAPSHAALVAKWSKEEPVAFRPFPEDEIPF